MKLLFASQLATQLGVSQFYVGSMKKAGCPFRGRKTTMLWAIKWLEANPWFKTTVVYPRRKRTGEDNSNRINSKINQINEISATNPNEEATRAGWEQKTKTLNLQTNH